MNCTRRELKMVSPVFLPSLHNLKAGPHSTSSSSVSALESVDFYRYGACPSKHSEAEKDSESKNSAVVTLLTAVPQALASLAVVAYLAVLITTLSASTETAATGTLASSVVCVSGAALLAISAARDLIETRLGCSDAVNLARAISCVVAFGCSSVSLLVLSSSATECSKDKPLRWQSWADAPAAAVIVLAAFLTSAARQFQITDFVTRSSVVGFSLAAILCAWTQSAATLSHKNDFQAVVCLLGGATLIFAVGYALEEYASTFSRNGFKYVATRSVSGLMTIVCVALHTVAIHVAVDDLVNERSAC